MTPAPTYVDSHHARVAELWLLLLEAAQLGDERARGFLDMFGPWAQDEPAARARP